MRNPSADLVLSVAEIIADIPAGRVVTYGDVAAVVGTGPRQVAAAMASGLVMGPWWRVIRSDGSLPLSLQPRAREHYLSEGTPLRDDASGTRVDMRRARWAFDLG